MPGSGAKMLAKLKDLLEACQVVLSDGCIDLEGNAGLSQAAHAAHRRIKGAGHAAEPVVAGSIGSINGDGAAIDAGFLYLPGRLRRNKRPVGRKGAYQPLVMGGPDKFVHVRPHHGLAAGEDDYGLSHLREGVNQGHGLFMAQFPGIGLHMSLGTAVPAGQVA